MKKLILYIIFICACFASIFGIPAILAYIDVDFNFISMYQFTWVSFVFLFALTLWAWFLFHIGLLCLRESTHFTKNKLVTYLLSFTFAYTALCAYSLNAEADCKEKKNRIAIADKLTQNKDERTEEKFVNIRQQILQDTFLFREIISLPNDSSRIGREEILNAYIKQTYFSGYFSAYNFQFTYCKADDNLRMGITDNIYNCQDYFDQKIEDLGTESTCSNLYRMNSGIEYLSYLAEFTFGNNEQTQYILYIELGCETIVKDPGYFDLLFADESPILSIDNLYSYSLYGGGNLLLHQGDFLYPLKMKIERDTVKFAFADWDGYNHYIRFLDDEKILVISKENPPGLSMLYAFSFLLLWFVLVGFLVYLLVYRKFSLSSWRFAQKLQFTILGILFSVLLCLCIISVFYIKKLSEAKNEGALREKTLSALLDLERRYIDFPAYPDRNSVPDSVLDLWKKDLKRLSVLLSTDIHLYDVKGNLMLSTQNRLFERGIMSDTMNAEALKMLQEKKSNLYIQKEKVENVYFLSAYTPFRNAKNGIFAYLNVPYFVKQAEWEREVGSYISSYITIYVFLIFVVLLVTIVLSNYLIRPLNLIAKHVADIELGKKNTHLKWTKKDEIGELVSQYNSLVDELEESAKLLAKSERQSAWSEMAKQVAHEIKNPLTPIKLQVQQLERAYIDRKPDFARRLQKFTTLILEQIDRLSDIATTFSQYAQWSKPDIKEVQLHSCIEKAVQLFENKNIHFELSNIENAISVKIDEKQFSQVLLNILKNAVQSIEQKQEQQSDNVGEIKIHAYPVNDCFVKKYKLDASLCFRDYIAIEIQDNGMGIEEATLTRIFEPNFTTKNSGSGLGLAISRRIMNGMSGGIALEKAEVGVSVGIWVEHWKV